MSNLTIRITDREKQELSAWAAVQGKSVTEYLKDLVAADMQSGSPASRAQAWMEQNDTALQDEAKYLARQGVPGADLAALYPNFDDEI